MVAFLNAQDKESTVFVLCSTNTPPKLNIVGFFRYRWTKLCKNCTAKGCTVDVQIAITVKARLANDV